MMCVLSVGGRTAWIEGANVGDIVPVVSACVVRYIPQCILDWFRGVDVE